MGSDTNEILKCDMESDIIVLISRKIIYTLNFI